MRSPVRTTATPTKTPRARARVSDAGSVLAPRTTGVVTRTAGRTIGAATRAPADLAARAGRSAGPAALGLRGGMDDLRLRAGATGTASRRAARLRVRQIHRGAMRRGRLTGIATGAAPPAGATGVASRRAGNPDGALTRRDPPPADRATAAGTGAPAVETAADRPGGTLDAAADARQTAAAAGRAAAVSAPPDVVAAAAAGASHSSAEAALAGAGIRRYGDLAAVRPGRLRKILRAGGGRMSDPRTWPQQAGLAAAGDWDQLAALQRELSRGRRRGAA